MPQTQFILSEVSRLIGHKAHVITYAISTGHLPEPKLRIAGKRIFSESEVENIKKYFDSNYCKGRPPKEANVK